VGVTNDNQGLSYNKSRYNTLVGLADWR